MIAIVWQKNIYNVYIYLPPKIPNKRGEQGICLLASLTHEYTLIWPSWEKYYILDMAPKKNLLLCAKGERLRSDCASDQSDQIIPFFDRNLDCVERTCKTLISLRRCICRYDFWRKANYTRYLLPIIRLIYCHVSFTASNFTRWNSISGGI